LAQSGEETPGKKLSPKELIDTAKRMIAERLAEVDTIIKDTQDVCKSLDNERDERDAVMMQIGDLRIAILEREKMSWQIYEQLMDWIFGLMDTLEKMIDAFGNKIAEKATQEELRIESTHIVEELLESIQKSTPKTLVRYVS
jgi:hypothetical protein